MSSGDQPPFTSQESKISTTIPTSTFNDMDAFINMDMYNSFPRSQSGSATSSSTNLSGSASQPPVQPSFPYDLYPQTIPLSTDFSMPEMTSGASSSVVVSQDLFDMDAQLNAMMPAFFFPENNSNTVNPASILGNQSNTSATSVETKQPFISQPPPQFDGKRLYAGIHTQRAAYNKEMEMHQRRMLAESNANNNNANIPSLRRESSTATTASSASDMSIDERINNVLNGLKPAKGMGKPASPGGILPHIARMRKDEEEMDEDERLLASEEGKKLSSKERRQLRNKVSARAFRSRRKEYITQLEAEVATKTSEAAELRVENTTLKSEIAQLQEFTRTVLRSPAFSSFLAEMEKAQQQQIQQLQQQSAPEMAPVEPQLNYRKDPNPNTHQLSADDWMFAPAAGAPSWATTPQVFSVYDLPQGPPALQNLSGKAINPASEVFDWSQFPPPVDGFSPNRGCGGMVSQPQQDVAVQQQQSITDDFTPPENLADLYEAKNVKISDRIEALSPGVGLDALLERLESVITGQVDVVDAFGAQAQQHQEQQVQQQSKHEFMDTAMEDYTDTRDESPQQYRQRCRSVADMFDAVESYKRVGAVVGV